MMARLNTHPNIDRPDDVYELLVDLHHQRTDIESLRVYAKLVMLLANHIGKHIPGNPNVMVQNMPAAGGMVRFATRR